MIEPKEDSKLAANVRKFEVLKEYVMSFYPKLENCTIRTDSGKHSSFQSPFLECKIYQKWFTLNLPIFSQTTASSEANKLIQPNNVCDYAGGRKWNSTTSNIL